MLNYNIETLKEAEAKEILVSLKKQIDILNKSYHTEDNPLVDDATYDAMVQQVNTIVQRFPSLTGLQGVGSIIQKDFVEITHAKQMLSLDNLFTEEDVIKFDEKIKRFLNINFSDKIIYSAEPKVDGLSLSIRYEYGKLIYAVTRGDGIKGEDVTLNIKTIKEIPQELKGDNPEILEVRGEVYISKDNFLNLNKKQKEQNSKIFANPRNLAAGSLRTLDTSITASRPLQFMAWGLGEIREKRGQKEEIKEGIYKRDSFYENLQFLKQQGFPVNPLNKLCYSPEELIEYYKYIEDIRSSIPYDIDGVVYKVDSLNLQKRLGTLIKSPRWASAHKFKAQTAITKILDITVQVGRTGVLTPVAELEAINIGGVIVTRASLHNEDEIKRKDIRKGDSVIVKRAGDIIPQVMAILLDYRPKDSVEFIMPKNCPVCGSPVFKDEEKVALKCSGGIFYCKAMFLEGLSHFVSKEGFDIDGFGEKQIEVFYNKGLLKEPSDIWQLKNHIKEIKQYEGFGEKSVTVLLESIEKARNISLNNFIYALGINQVGYKTAKILAKYYKNITNLIETFKNIKNDTSLKDQINISGMGDSLLNDITLYFQHARTYNVLMHLLRVVNVQIYQEEETISSKILGKNILFTGSLKTLSRSEAKSLAERNGATVLGSVSKKLDYLVVGEDAGSKLKKAIELNITVITEEDFKELLNHN